MQLLRDNLTLWTSDMTEAGELLSPTFRRKQLTGSAGGDKKEEAEESKEEPVGTAAAAA